MRNSGATVLLSAKTLEKGDIYPALFQPTIKLKIFEKRLSQINYSFVCDRKSKPFMRHWELLHTM